MPTALGVESSLHLSNIVVANLCTKALIDLASAS